MVGYYLSLGYNGATRIDYEEMWRILATKTREICDSPQAIIAEARRLGAPEICDRGGACALDGYADNYAEAFGSGGHPIIIFDENHPSWHIEEGEHPIRARQVRQQASTSCDIKYHVRRAFIRLLIEAMHRERIEVNLQVE